MQKYKIAIEESLRKVVEIEADTPELAVCQAEDAYNNEEYVLSAEDFIGVDIALSQEDEVVKNALKEPAFIEYVERRFEERRSLIPIDDKIRMTFGSSDNALIEFNERHTAPKKTLLFLLYRCDAWCTSNSMELIAPFTSFDLAAAYLRSKRCELRLTEEDLDSFVRQRQTQGRNENYYCEEVEVNPVVETNARKDADFYDKVFSYGTSELSRQELEELPVPFCTENVTDQQMERIVFETETETRSRLRLNDGEKIDFENDKHREIWWEELEQAVRRQNIPYYES